MKSTYKFLSHCIQSTLKQDVPLQEPASDLHTELRLSDIWQGTFSIMLRENPKSDLDFIFNYLLELDSNKNYLLKSGRNDTQKPFTFLTCVDDHWKGYRPDKGSFEMCTDSGELTETAKGILNMDSRRLNMDASRWGPGTTQYSIEVCEINEEHLILTAKTFNEISSGAAPQAAQSRAIDRAQPSGAGEEKKSDAAPAPSKTPYLNQDCAEMMTRKAAEIMKVNLGDSLEYSSETPIQDVQIDLCEVLMFCGQSEQRDPLWVGDEVTSEERFLQEISKLKKEQCYFFRTGKNGDSGHFQLLFFESGQWRMFSSENNKFDVTTANHHNDPRLFNQHLRLTQDGKNKLIFSDPKCTATWGYARGNHSTLVYPVNGNDVIKVAQFIRNTRLHGPEVATAQLWATNVGYDPYSKSARTWG